MPAREGEQLGGKSLWKMVRSQRTAFAPANRREVVVTARSVRHYRRTYRNPQMSTEHLLREFHNQMYRVHTQPGDAYDIGDHLHHSIQTGA